MQRFIVLVFLVSLMVVWRAQAQGPDDQYVNIYNLIQQADALNGTEPQQALARYLEAQSNLQQLQRGYPDWNTRVVNFRLNYLAAKIADLSQKFPSLANANAQPISANAVASAPSPPLAIPPTPAAPPPKAPTPSSQISAAAPATAPSALEGQVAALRSQVGQLQADKALLEAKLKEAFAAQPAAVDPRELARTEEQVKALQKENESLKSSLAQEKFKLAAPASGPAANTKSLEASRQALAGSNAKLKEQTERADLLALQKEALQNQLNNLQHASRSAPPASDATRKALEDANRKLSQQTALAKQLAADKRLLETRLAKADSQAEAAAALLLENQVLKKQLADLKATPPPPAPADDVRRQLAQAQAQIAALQSDKEILRLEKIALENRVKQTPGPVVASTPPPALSKPADAMHIKELELERDNLKKQLALALQQTKGRKDRAAEARVKEMEDQVATLRSRLTVYEAKRTPYSAEELALFHQPAPQLAQPTSPSQTGSKIEDPGVSNGSTKSVNEPPAGAATLVAEAHRYFSNRQFDKAEERYLQVLRQDDKNVYTLANLAAIQLELNHLDEAEQHVQQALAAAPGDAYSLLILGQVKLRQEKYDESLDALSRAAKSDPENPQIQNFLGVTLSHKGMRIPAETALRKAIELDPGYASAHNNLAVVYVTQQPPAVALARWHYQKALAAGHPRNPDLEKMLEAPLTADRGK